MEQVLFSLPLSKLELIFKRWIKEAQLENQPPAVESENPEQLLTIQEAASLLHLTVPTIYSKVSRKELPVMKRSKRLYFSKQSLIEWVQQGRQKSNAEIEAEAVAYLSKTKKRLNNGK